MIKEIVTLCLMLIIAGCSAALVPYTFDPFKKIQYAYELTNSNRAIPAERLGREALEDFKEQKNIFGMAEAHTFLGTFYKSRTYRNYAKYYEDANEYDPTSNLSITHFEKAAIYFKKDNDLWGAAKATFGAANAYGGNGNSEKQCELYNEALSLYLSKDNKFKGRIHTHNPNFKDYEEMINAFKDKYCNK